MAPDDSHLVSLLPNHYPKFVCVNDDMKDPSPELQQMLHDFYVSYFPNPSRFELPDGQVNRCVMLLVLPLLLPRLVLQL